MIDPVCVASTQPQTHNTRVPTAHKHTCMCWPFIHMEGKPESPAQKDRPQAQPAREKPAPSTPSTSPAPTAGPCRCASAGYPGATHGFHTFHNSSARFGGLTWPGHPHAPHLAPPSMVSPSPRPTLSSTQAHSGEAHPLTVLSPRVKPSSGDSWDPLDPPPDCLLPLSQACVSRGNGR